MSEIRRIDGEEGRTYETPNGTLKSVTTFLSLLHKPALVPWAAKMSAQYFKDELDAIIAGELDIQSMDIDEIVREAKAHYKKKSEEAAEFGTLVHKHITDYFRCGILPADDKVRALVESGISMIGGKLGLTVRDSEKMVYYKSCYAGTLDLVGTAHTKAKPEVAVVDIKTGKGRVYEEALLQVSAYALAEEWLMQAAQVDLAIILPLNKETGEAGELVVLKRRQWKRYAKAFLSLVQFDADIAKARKK